MPSANTANLNLLWQHINITHEGDRLIILTSLVGMLSPDIQFPFLEFTGQQGSGKTDTQEFLRMLVDPNAVLSAGAPTTKEDIYIAAINNAVVSYNNLSYINEERQDVFCNLTTGGGMAKRALYTNDTEFAVPIKRPVLARRGMNIA